MSAVQLYVSCRTYISYLPFYQWWNNGGRCSCCSKWETLTEHFINLSGCCIGNVFVPLQVFLGLSYDKKNHKPLRVRSTSLRLLFLKCLFTKTNKQALLCTCRTTFTLIWNEKKSHSSSVSKPTVHILVHLLLNVWNLYGFGNFLIRPCWIVGESNGQQWTWRLGSNLVALTY